MSDFQDFAPMSFVMTSTFLSAAVAKLRAESSSAPSHVAGMLRCDEGRALSAVHSGMRCDALPAHPDAIRNLHRTLGLGPPQPSSRSPDDSTGDSFHTRPLEPVGAPRRSESDQVRSRWRWCRSGSATFWRLVADITSPTSPPRPPTQTFFLLRGVSLKSCNVTEWLAGARCDSASSDPTAIPRFPSAAAPGRW